MTKHVPKRPNVPGASCNLSVFRILKIRPIILLLHCCRCLELQTKCVFVSWSEVKYSQPLSLSYDII